MRAITVALLSGLIPGASSVLLAGQDWKALFEDLVNPDETISAKARETAFSKLVPHLLEVDAASADAEIAEIVPLFDDPRESVRLQVSGLIAGTAALRNDGLLAIRSAMPVLLRQFHDSQSRVRANAIRTVATVRPSPPIESLSFFKDLLTDSDARVVGTATTGLMRLSPSIPSAEQAVREFLGTEKRPDRLQSALYGIAESGFGNEETVSVVAALLGHRDERVALTSAYAIQKLGPRAGGARDALDRVRRDPESSPQLRTAAQAAIAAISQ
jgi:hypothetical protein